MVKKIKENFRVFSEINASNTSWTSVFKTFLFIVPILLLVFQFIFVGKIVDLYVSPFKSGTVILIVLLSTQLPGLAVYRRMLGLELFPLMFSFITAISIFDPLLNLLFVSMAENDLIDYTSIGFEMMIIGTNIFFMIVFFVVCWSYRKKLYSIFKIMIISTGIALVSQFLVLVTVSLPKDLLLAPDKSFTTGQFMILIVGTSWFLVSSAMLSLFIKYKVRKISIFNRLSRYSLAGIITIPISLIGIGTFRASLKEGASKELVNLVTFKDDASLVVVLTVAAIILLTFVIFIAHLKFGVVPSTIKFMALVKTTLALMGSAIVYIATDSEMIANLSLIIIGVCSVIAHIALSYLRGLCQNEIKTSSMVDANYFLTLLLMGVYTFIILLRYDVIVSQKLFSPNLLFIVVQVGVTSLLLMMFMKERSQTLIREEGV